MSTVTPLPVPSFSSPLTEALSRFLAFKRAAGCRYIDEARALRLLDEFLTTTLDADDPVITLDVVRRFVARRGTESETTNIVAFSRLWSASSLVMMSATIHATGNPERPRHPSGGWSSRMMSEHTPPKSINPDINELAIERRLLQ